MTIASKLLTKHMLLIQSKKTSQALSAMPVEGMDALRRAVSSIYRRVNVRRMWTGHFVRHLKASI